MNNWINISDASAIILGVLIVIISIFSRGRILAFRLFNIYIFCLTLLAIQSLLVETRIIYSFPHLFRVTMPFRYLLGPLVYLFIRSSLLDERRLRKFDWLHLVPFLLHYIILMPFLFSSAKEKIEIIEYFIKTGVLIIPSFKSPLLNPKWHGVLHQLSYFIYNIITIRLYIKCIKSKKDVSELNNRPVYRFVKIIIIIMSTASLIIITSGLVLSPTSMTTLVRLIISIVLLLLAITLILHPEFLYSTNHPLEIKKRRFKLVSQIKLDQANLIAMSNTNNESNIFLSLDYKLLYFNSLAKKEFFNIYEKELEIGMDFKEFIFKETENKFNSSFAKATAGIKNEFYALSNISKTEKEWHSHYFTPIYNNQKALLGISITSQNINKEINAQVQTKRYIKNLEDIAWKEVHLLNKPISNLFGITKLLLKPESDISKDEQDILINHISVEVERLDIVIKDIVEKINETVKQAPKA